MKTYGYSPHDAKVEDYGTYKKENFKKRKQEVKQVVNNIFSSSLTEYDKKTILRELADIINENIYNQNK